MTVDQIIAVLDDHGFGDTASARKLEVVNDAYQEIVNSQPWPFLEVKITPVVTSEGQITAPTDIKAVLALHSGTKRLFHMDYEQLIEYYGEILSVTGEPWAYYFVGNAVWVYPAKALTTATLFYLRIAADLAVGGAEATILLPKQYHRAIIEKALTSLYTMEDDADIAASFEQRADRRIAQMYGALMTRQYTDPRFIDVVDDGYGD